MSWYDQYDYEEQGPWDDEPTELELDELYSLQELRMVVGSYDDYFV